MRNLVNVDFKATANSDRTAAIAPIARVLSDIAPHLGGQRSQTSRLTTGGATTAGPLDTALGWHVMIRLDDSRVIARTPGERRVIAQTLFARGRRVDLLAFRVADTHIHALLVCGRAEAGRFARYAASSMRRRLRLPVGFNAHLRPVQDQRHLYNTFRYVLRQEERHGTCLDPTHDGSSLVDLLGLRVIAPWSIERVRALLPRVCSAELHEMLGVDVQMAPADLRHLRESAAAAVGAVSFSHHGALASLARVAATQIARASGLSHRQVGRLLDLDERTTRRLETQPIHAVITRATLLQLRLRSALWTASESLASSSSVDTL